MKNVLIFLFLSHTIGLWGQWQTLEAPGTSGAMNLIRHDGKLFALNFLSVSGPQLRRSLTNGLIWEIVPAPINNARFVSIDGDDNFLVALMVKSAGGAAVFLSTDGAQSWTQLTDPPGGGTFDAIYVASGNVLYNKNRNELYRYDYNSQTWGWVLNTTYSQDAFDMYLGAAWSGDIAGFRYSSDGGSTWQEVTNAPFTGIRSVAIGDHYVQVVSDMGEIYSFNGSTWALNNFPMDYDARVFADGDNYYASTNGKLYFSDDPTTTYSALYQNIASSFVDINGFWVLSTYKGIYRSAHNPTDWHWAPSGQTFSWYTGELNRLCSAGGALFYNSAQTAFSTDLGDNWHVTTNGLAMNECAHQNGVWLARANWNKLYRSTNLSDWTYVSGVPGNIDSLLFLASVNGVFVKSSGYGGDEIHVSYNNGDNWQLSGNAPGRMVVHHNNLYAHPWNSAKLMRSTDLGASWQEVGTDIFATGPNIDDLASDGTKLYAVGYNKVFVSPDDGQNWAIHDAPADFSGDYAVNNGVILAHTNNNVLLVSNNDGATWAVAMSGFNSTPIGHMVSVGNSIVVLDVDHIPHRRDFSVFNSAQYSGIIYNDLNNNQLYDTGDTPASDVILHLNNTGLYTSPASSGLFSILSEQQNGLLTAETSLKYCTISPQSYPVFNTNDQLNFALNCPAGITDLSVQVSHSTPFRPGFETDIVLTVENTGNDAASGTLSLAFDPALQFVSASPAASVTGNLANWSIANIQTREQQIYSLRVLTPSTTPLGKNICNNAQVTPAATDQFTDDNSQTSCSVSVGSFDPNDKTVNINAFKPATPGTEPNLAYTIRFQNTGTYPASLVLVRDTLSSNLDPGTFKLLASSHPCTWSLRGHGILEFRFEGINLPDSNSNEPGSHGFVRFSIKPNVGLPLGAAAHNTAYIFFDFNEPVVTNTVTTTVTPAHEAKYVVLQPLVSPNPATDQILIQWPENIQNASGTLFVQDESGRTIKSQSVDNKAVVLDVSNLKPGQYHLWGLLGFYHFSAKFEVMR